MWAALKRLYELYMIGARANYFPLREWGFLGEKKRPTEPEV